MDHPPVPGAVIDGESGKLYLVAGGEITVLFPWPALRAYRRPLKQPKWGRCNPTFMLPLVLKPDTHAPLDLFCAAIPQDVQRAVAPFVPHHWTMLEFIARSGSAAIDLCATNPALAFMVASAVPMSERRRSGQLGPAPVHLPYRKQREILDWLGFPATDSVRRTVRKITHGALDVEWLRPLRRRIALRDVAERLAHLPRINSTILRMTAEGTLLHVSSRLLRQIAEGPETSPLVDPRLLADTVRMWRTMPPSQRRAVRPFDRPERIVATHDRLAREAADRDARPVRNPSAPGDYLRPPPYPGTMAIRPLTTLPMLYAEAKAQNNCLASYGPVVRSGRYAVYKVVYPERCTVGLKRRPGGGWWLDQIKGFANAEVRFETVTFVRAWFNREVADEAARLEVSLAATKLPTFIPPIPRLVVTPPGFLPFDG